MEIEEKYREVGIMTQELQYIQIHNKNIEYNINNGLSDNRLRFLFAEASLTVMLLERLCRIYVMEKNNQDRIDKTLGPLLNEIRDDGLISNDKKKSTIGFQKYILSWQFRTTCGRMESL